MREKKQKIRFGSEIIPLELVALNTRFYWENILVIGGDFFFRVIKIYNKNIAVRI